MAGRRGDVVAQAVELFIRLPRNDTAMPATVNPARTMTSGSARPQRLASAALARGVGADGTADAGASRGVWQRERAGRVSPRPSVELIVPAKAMPLDAESKAACSPASLSRALPPPVAEATAAGP